MDIITHAGIGLIAASPFLTSHTELALGIAAGSVLPDLDALSRLWNKRAFLRTHQTWTHALPVQFAASLVIGASATSIGWNGFGLGTGLLAGLIGHSLLDLTNTFGVAWLKPFSQRRFCLEWVFFIDAIVFLATSISLALVIPVWLGNKEASSSRAVSFFAFLTIYIASKAFLRRRAGRSSATFKSLVPSVLVPWRFFGTDQQTDTITLFRINALTGKQTVVVHLRLLDEAFAGVLKSLPDFRLMREISPQYHVVSATPDGPGTHLLCRDMRVRNFGTRFGDLEVWLDANRQITRSRFHV